MYLICALEPEDHSEAIAEVQKVRCSFPSAFQLEMRPGSRSARLWSGPLERNFGRAVSADARVYCIPDAGLARSRSDASELKRPPAFPLPRETTPNGRPPPAPRRGPHAAAGCRRILQRVGRGRLVNCARKRVRRHRRPPRRAGAPGSAIRSRNRRRARPRRPGFGGVGGRANTPFDLARRTHSGTAPPPQQNPPAPRLAAQRLGPRGGGVAAGGPERPLSNFVTRVLGIPMY
ncbi:hypothetical protein M885DRAFT_41667 [Pelagophyceae sp. CCMP2097]|nr:hypothetical protein M885DRAFT_41667 [Pelagophyceae sp. CCMP2097]